jgi:hypothetical protein
MAKRIKIETKFRAKRANRRELKKGDGGIEKVRRDGDGEDSKGGIRRGRNAAWRESERVGAGAWE